MAIDRATALQQALQGNSPPPQTEESVDDGSQYVDGVFGRATQYQTQVEEAAKKYKVPTSFISAVMEQETGHVRGNRAETVTSPAGAVGLMQVMPATGRSLGFTNLTDPTENIEAGVKYLSEQLDRFNGDFDLAAAAYNAGPNRQSLEEGRIPNITETKNYVASVSSMMDNMSSKYGGVNEAVPHEAPREKPTYYETAVANRGVLTPQQAISIASLAGVKDDASAQSLLNAANNSIRNAGLDVEAAAAVVDMLPNLISSAQKYSPNSTVSQALRNPQVIREAVSQAPDSLFGGGLAAKAAKASMSLLGDQTLVSEAQPVIRNIENILGQMQISVNQSVGEAAEAFESAQALSSVRPATVDTTTPPVLAGVDAGKVVLNFEPTGDEEETEEVVPTGRPEIRPLPEIFQVEQVLGRGTPQATPNTNLFQTKQVQPTVEILAPETNNQNQEIFDRTREAERNSATSNFRSVFQRNLNEARGREEEQESRSSAVFRPARDLTQVNFGNVSLGSFDGGNTREAATPFAAPTQSFKQLPSDLSSINNRLVNLTGEGSRSFSVEPTTIGNDFFSIYETEIDPFEVVPGLQTVTAPQAVPQVPVPPTTSASQIFRPARPRFNGVDVTSGERVTGSTPAGTRVRTSQTGSGARTVGAGRGALTGTGGTTVVSDRSFKARNSEDRRAAQGRERDTSSIRDTISRALGISRNRNRTSSSRNDRRSNRRERRKERRRNRRR